MTPQTFVWRDVLLHVRDLAIAYAFAFPIGWNREREDHSAGLRTFPLVAVASCGLVLVAAAVLGPASPQQSRILQGLLTGVGFIGGGAILKEGAAVRGTATAASVWNVGIIGAAVGYGLYDIGLVLGLVNYLTLRFLGSKKRDSDGVANPPRLESDTPPASDRS